MPLLLIPATAFQNDAQLAIPSVYAIVERVSYATRERIIRYHVGYYASEAAYVACAAALRLNGLSSELEQPATPEEANAVPIFQFLEAALFVKMREQLGPEATITNVA